MSRATRPEAVGAGEKVLLVHILQNHNDRPLTYLVFESWKAERPTRSIRLRNICSSDRRRLVAAGLNASQEVQEIGLQVFGIVHRRHTVDAGGTILAGEPVGLLQPFQIDDVVQRGQSHPSFRSCQFSYPLPFRGQVCKAQSPLPCCPPTVLSSRRPPSLDRVPASPVPRRHQYYEGATTPTHASPVTYWFRFQGPRKSSLLRARCYQRSQAVGGSASGQGHCSAGDPICRRSLTWT